MTDKEKMLNGQPFYGKDKELMNDKAKARSLANKYNSIDDLDECCERNRRKVSAQ